MNAVTTLVENRIVKLRADNEVLVRQIPFLAQRLDDLKALLGSNIREIATLGEFLSAAQADTLQTSVGVEKGSTTEYDPHWDRVGG